MNEYPSFFPSGVPPESSMDAHGTAFRLVNNDPPTSSDFRAYHLEKKNPKPTPSPSDCGTSMFRGLENVENLREVSLPLRGKKIAKGMLNKSHGKVSEPRKKDTHFEAWLRENAGIEQDFKVVK